MKTMRRIIAAMLLMTVLVLSLASCNGGGGNNNNPIASDGKISEDMLKESGYLFWEGDNGAQNAGSYTVSFSEMEEALAKGGRIWRFSTQPKKYSEDISLEDFKRVKFTIEADRDTVVYISAGQGELGVDGAKRYELKAGVPTNIEAEGEDRTKVYYCVAISPTENGVGGDFKYKTAAFAEWYQTNYKITNIEYFTK